MSISNTRILGLDFGSRTIGVAVSDPFGWTAQGVCVLRRTHEDDLRENFDALETYISQYGIGLFVLGYPKNMNNTEGPRCEKTRAFQKRLGKRFPNIPVVLQDERMSTISAERSLLEANLSRKKRGQVIDMTAAIFILQHYLDAQAVRARAIAKETAQRQGEE